jgi:hypothetical protein
MTRAPALALLLAACGAPAVDGSLAVTVVAPNGGEVLVAAEPFELRWTTSGAAELGVDGAALVSDVALVDEGGGTIAIAEGITGSSLTWAPPGVAAATRYRLRVTARAGSASASDSSDDAFTVAPPDGAVSLARDVQPIFTLRCATRFCHEHATQAAILDLSVGAARAALVDVPSATAACRTFIRVRPGMPDQSYLVWKLAGAGTCLAGVRMPKDAAPLSATELALVRGWIGEGARPN